MIAPKGKNELPCFSITTYIAGTYAMGAQVIDFATMLSISMYRLQAY